MAPLDVGLFVRVNGQGISFVGSESLKIIAVEEGFQLAIVMPYALAPQKSEVSNSAQHFERDQTPHRFRSKRQLWTYSGLGIETRDSAQYRWVQGQLQRSKKPQQIRGLNQNHNHEMKEIFKGAATRASCGKGPLHDFYAALLAKGETRDGGL
jgi:hypothetical protein